MKTILSFSIILLLASCGNSKTTIDTLIINGTVYTVDSNFSKVEALAIDAGKIIETGLTSDLQNKYKATEIIDAKGGFVFPGFIDAHAHFMGYAESLQQADLTGTRSWQEIIETVKAFSKTHPDGWLRGQGWDQNDWEHKAFPDNKVLNELFPDRPVVLERVDGHAVIANQKALDIAGIKPGEKISGGEIQLKDGRLSGILVDNAIGLVTSKIPRPTPEQTIEGLTRAQENCFAAGLTQVEEMGMYYKTAVFIDSLQKAGKLRMKLYVLLSDAADNYKWLFEKGKIKTDRLSIRGFKAFADGALGSRGACLLQPYSDRPGWSGFLLNTSEHFDSIANIIYQHDMQLCTHAIGDSGVRTILNVYAKYLKGKNDKRWRIEHSQIVNPDDFAVYGDNNIIPSVQPTHATSDMYWAGERIGPERLKGAYANRELLKQNGWLPFGTDFPVEDISPVKTFYAAVFRQDAKGYPEGGFQMENAVSREDAVRAMTIWAAKAAFQENETGSLEPGTWADIVILDTDLLNAPQEDILNTRTLATFVNGEKVFANED